MKDITGSVALVTGGNRGLGRATVEELLTRGVAKVYATARHPEPSDDPRIVPLALEVTDDDAIASVAAAASDVTIVVNNAGIVGTRESLLQTTPTNLQQVFATNVFAPLRIAQAFAPILAANRNGTLVDIHSAVSWAPGFGVYGASKAAFWSLTNSLRVELATQGTLVIGVHLGFADTDLTAALDVPKIDPRDVARAIVNGIEQEQPEVLVDEASRYIKSLLSGPVEDLHF